MDNRLVYPNIKYVYHYCKSDVLIKLVENKIAWLSKLGAMNDRSEGLFAIELGREVFRKLYEPKYSQNRSNFPELESLSFALSHNTVSSGGLYVMSFSGDGDSLPQWRGYTPDGGYSLGIPLERIKHFCDQNGYKFVDCIYKRAEQVELLKELFESSRKEINRDKDEGSMYFATELRNLAVQFKHPSFEDELEYRIVVDAEKQEIDRKIRADGALLKSFIELNIERLFHHNHHGEDPACETNRDTIKTIDIVVSPGLNSDHVRNDFLRWAEQHNIPSSNFRQSKSPYLRK